MQPHAQPAADAAPPVVSESQGSLHLTDIQEVPPLSKKEARSQKAKERREEIERKKQEAKMKREADAARKAQEKKDEAEQKAKQRFEQQQADRKSKAEQLVVEREQAAKARTQATEARKKARAEDLKKQRAEKSKVRRENLENAKQAENSKKVQERMQRDREADERKEKIEARKKLHLVDGKRERATHIRLNAEGLTTPHEYSVRGQVLKHLHAHHKPGDIIAIADLAEACKAILFGANIRASLNKLDETAHVDTLHIDDLPALNAGEQQTAD